MLLSTVLLHVQVSHVRLHAELSVASWLPSVLLSPALLPTLASVQVDQVVGVVAPPPHVMLATL